MLTVKFFIIDIFARLGIFFCSKAIQLADNGKIDFEVAGNQNSISFIYQTKPRYSVSSIFDVLARISKTIFFSFFIGTIVWTSLNIIF